jgi:hypothetical protein
MARELKRKLREEQTSADPMDEDVAEPQVVAAEGVSNAPSAPDVPRGPPAKSVDEVNKMVAAVEDKLCKDAAAVNFSRLETISSEIARISKRIVTTTAQSDATSGKALLRVDALYDVLMSNL